MARRHRGIDINAHTRKTYDAIMSGPAPRDLEWAQFEALWQEIADDARTEHGDRLVVVMHGHREVFHRPHDARVAIADIERARRLIAHDDLPGTVVTTLVVAVDEEHARFVEIGPPRAGVHRPSGDVRDQDHRARRLRTVERRTGRHDAVALDAFFDDIAAAMLPEAEHVPVVLLGHGAGNSNSAHLFLERLRQKHPQLVAFVTATGTIDLSNATDAEIEIAARRASGS